jgi:hypothetical protein
MPSGQEINQALDRYRRSRAKEGLSFLVNKVIKRMKSLDHIKYSLFGLGEFVERVAP